MNRQVLVICESRNKMRSKSAKVLDRYLWRCGRRTWKGTASNACLYRISEDLKAVASRNMSVAVYEIKKNYGSKSPLFIVGSKARFGSSGVFPVSTSPKKGVLSSKTEYQKALRSIVSISALFHDVGKAMRSFQFKIKAALNNDLKKNYKVDPVRHEVYSAYYFDEISSAFKTDKEFFDNIKNIDFDAAAERASDRVFNLYTNNPSSGSDTQMPFRCANKSGFYIRFTILQIILSHHRLTDHDSNLIHSRTKKHIEKNDNNSKLSKDSFCIVENGDIWNNVEWKAKLHKQAFVFENINFDKISSIYDFVSIGRSALMMSDHIGSYEKNNKISVYDINLPIANTYKNDDEIAPADDLLTHTNKVYKNVRAAVRILNEYRCDDLPGIALEDCPELLLETSSTEVDVNYEWQSEASKIVRNIVSSRSGGFFGIIMGKTGCGKTIGAAKLISSATYFDIDESRRKMRFCLGLGLRTLTVQSGNEYVSTIGFNREQVATVIGERGGNTEDYEHSDVPGSENRLSHLPNASFYTKNPDLIDDFPKDNEEETKWLNSLSGKNDDSMPIIIDKFIESSRSPTIYKFLSTPILSTTIDHLMPVASANRGSHLDSEIRARTSDLIIDEVDQFSEEDLSALSRLIYIVGSSGRRVIIMSATLPKCIAINFYESYKEGWSHYAASCGKEDHVNILCTGDIPNSIFTNKNNENINEVYEASIRETISQNKNTPPLRIGMVLDKYNSFKSAWQSIEKGIFQLHNDNNIIHNNIKISAGLIAITRINHINELAKCIQKNDKIYMKTIFLHSHMFPAQRREREKKLKNILTRKGPNPNKYLIEFLENEGVINDAQSNGYDEVSLVIISSPVIETGNDIDFDWAVIDPSSTRKIPQVAGRVNRHRKTIVSKPNICIMTHYLVDSLEDNGFSNPGVESSTAKYTEVESVKIISDNDGRKKTFIPQLFDNEDIMSNITSNMSIDSEIKSNLRDAEHKLITLFFNLSWSTEKYCKNPTARMSAEYPKRRAFRRQNGTTFIIKPKVKNGVIDWLSYKKKGSSISKNGIKVNLIADDNSNQKQCLLEFDYDTYINENKNNRNFEKDMSFSITLYGKNAEAQNIPIIRFDKNLGYTME